MAIEANTGSEDYRKLMEQRARDMGFVYPNEIIIVNRTPLGG
jgi:Fe2+ transport system protein FeoA